MRVVEAINAALNDFLAQNPKALLMGEDLVDPYGGAFKVSKGLSTKFPQQVLSTPISEAGFTGVAIGLALKGRPVCVELMFGDFITLTTDQIINHLAKLPWVYNEQISLPVVIRAPMGGRRGYGSTHSQSLEKHYCGVPGLTVYAVSEFSDIGSIYGRAFSLGQPSLIIENKVTYARDQRQNKFFDATSPDAVFVAYGGCVADCVSAAERLYEEEEVVVKVVEVCQLWPFENEKLLAEVGDCQNVIAVEEGSSGWGFGSEVARCLISKSELRFTSVCGPDHPLPSALDWEIRLLPSTDKLIATVLETLRGEI